MYDTARTAHLLHADEAGDCDCSGETLLAREWSGYGLGLMCDTARTTHLCAADEADSEADEEPPLPRE